jgi:hypothetical protein
MGRLGLALTFGLCNVLLGCSSDDAANGQSRGFPSDQTCGLRVELTGAITASATGSDTDTRCVGTTGDSSQGFSVSFHAVQGNMPIFHLAVPTARKGAARNDLPAMVSLDDGTMAWLTSNCVVDIEQRFIAAAAFGGEVDLITGNGRCTSAAVNSPSSSTVSVGPFEFVTLVMWAS